MHGSAVKYAPGFGSDHSLAYRVPRAAELIGISERKAWQLVRSGAIESHKIGAARLVTRAALIRFLASLPTGATK